MSIERVFHCDWRECDGHVRTAARCPSAGFISVTEHGLGQQTLHFCTWDCLLRFAGEKPPAEVIPWAEADA